MLKDNALEIFLVNGMTYLLAFDNTQVQVSLSLFLSVCLSVCLSVFVSLVHVCVYMGLCHRICCTLIYLPFSRIVCDTFQLKHLCL